MTEQQFNERLSQAIADLMSAPAFSSPESWNRFILTLDSVQLIEMVVAIETEFRVSIPDAELSLDVFRDHAALYRMITALKSP